MQKNAMAKNFAHAIRSEEKLESERRAFSLAGVSFRKIIVRDDVLHRTFDETGVLNLYSLLLFGTLVEEKIGRARHLALYWLSGLAGGLLHVALDPRGNVPCVGASGCIAGVLAYSALAFPDVRLRVFDMRLAALLPRGLRFSARTYLWLWLACQALLVREQVRGGGDVSALAHLGGAAVGWAFFLALREPPRYANRSRGGRYDRR